MDLGLPLTIDSTDDTPLFCQRQHRRDQVCREQAALRQRASSSKRAGVNKRRTIATQFSNIAVNWPNKGSSERRKRWKSGSRTPLEMFNGCGMEVPPEQLVDLVEELKKDLPEIDGEHE